MARMDVPFSASYKRGMGGNPCYLCGRDVKNPKYLIHVCHGGHVLVTEDDCANDGSCLGGKVVGSDCWKQHPEIHKFGGKS